MHDLIIIGAGPAGLTAALYATRKRLSYLVISKDLGGKSNYSVEIPEDESHQTIEAGQLVTVYKNRLQYLRHSYKLTGVTSLRVEDGHFEIDLEDGSTELARAVVVATGTHARKLGIPGEMEFLSRALGYSSVNYSHILAGKRVFLAGDTDRVVSSALELSIHSRSVTVALFSGGTYDPTLLNRVRELDRVEILENATIRQFQGDEYARSVVVETNGTERTIEADGFFIEPEPTPNTSFVADGVGLNDRGYFVVDGTNMTTVPGLFAAGDVTGNGHEQILVSLGEGAKAGLSAHRYLLELGLQGS